MAISIALVDDELTFQCEFKKQLAHYSKEHNLEIEASSYYDGVSFLNSYKPNTFDIVFMDIQLGKDNGIDVSKQLRQIDNDVIIIFITNLAQYAIKGYEVDALDFVVKPISYYVLSMKLTRAIQRLKGSKSQFKLSISFENRKFLIDVSSIQYIEVRGHKLTFYASEDVFYTYDYSLSEIEKLFSKNGINFFSRINNYLLINLNFISSLSKYDIVLGNRSFSVSRARRAKFNEQLGNFYSQGK